MAADNGRWSIISNYVINATHWVHVSIFILRNSKYDVAIGHVLLLATFGSCSSCKILEITALEISLQPTALAHVVR